MNKDLDPKVNYEHTMMSLRQQMSSGERLFSRFIHNDSVEAVSSVLAATIGRPSILLGATVGGLVFGASLYIYAREYGLMLTSSEIIIGLLIGGLIGLIVECLGRIFKR